MLICNIQTNYGMQVRINQLGEQGIKPYSSHFHPGRIFLEGEELCRGWHGYCRVDVKGDWVGWGGGVDFSQRCCVV